MKEIIEIGGRPIPLFQKFNNNLKNCETISREEYAKVGELVDYYWHSRRIELEPVFSIIIIKYYLLIFQEMLLIKKLIYLF